MNFFKKLTSTFQCLTDSSSALIYSCDRRVVVVSCNTLSNTTLSNKVVVSIIESTSCILSVININEKLFICYSNPVGIIGTLAYLGPRT